MVKKRDKSTTELTLEMVSEEDRRFMYETYAPDPTMKKNVGIRRRLMPLIGNDRPSFELLHGVLLSLPGSPFLYYGDEIGMGDNHLLNDRDGVRTPMHWDASPTAGFSSADPSRFHLPLLDKEPYTPAQVNVAAQQADPSSLLNWLRNLLAVRKRLPVLGSHAFELLDTGDPAVLGYQRGNVYVLANFGTRPVTTGVPGGLEDAFTGRRVAHTVELGPRRFCWLVMS